MKKINLDKIRNKKNYEIYKEAYDLIKPAFLIKEKELKTEINDNLYFALNKYEDFKRNSIVHSYLTDLREIKYHFDRFTKLLKVLKRTKRNTITVDEMSDLYVSTVILILQLGLNE